MRWDDEVAKRDYLPVYERRALQLERLRRTVQYVYEHVPFYHQALDQQRVEPEDIRSLDDLPLLPFTTREDLIDHYPLDLLAVPRDQIVRIHASSGTKGRSKIVAYTRNDLDIWSEVCARALVCAGVLPGDTVHNAYGYGLFTGGLGLHYGGEALGALVVPISSGNTQRQVIFLRDLKASALCCTPSYALTIAEAMSKVGVSPDQLELKVGIFGAEPWTRAMSRQIERRLGITALDIYGLSEIIGPGVAMECSESHRADPDGRTLHIFEDHFLPEIVDAASGDPLPPGQEGELVFTTITKEGMPLLRYRTGDLCQLIPEPCSCGRTLIRMSQIKGRVDDMLIIRGINVYPSEIERILLNVPELAPHYQIILERRHTLDEAVVETEVTPQFQARLGEIEPGDATWSSHHEVTALQHKVGALLRETLGLHIHARVLPGGILPRSEGKATRIIDRRT